MKKMRLISIITILILLFPTQVALAGYRRPVIPVITLAPITKTTPINSTVTYQVGITNIPPEALHCVKVNLRVPVGYKVYPSNGYSTYHLYAGDATFLNNLTFKVKMPNTTQRRFFHASMSWSKDYKCRSIRTTNYSNEVEIIVTK